MGGRQTANELGGNKHTAFLLLSSVAVQRSLFCMQQWNAGQFRQLILLIKQLTKENVCTF